MDRLPRTHAGAWRLTLGVTAALTALRLIVAGRIGLGVDEAHYALYGLHLDWSYFDHPPLVGWLQAAVLATLGDGERALRVAPILLGAALPPLVHTWTRRLQPDGPPALPALAALLVAGAPMLLALGLALVPEGPLLVLTVLLALALTRLVRQPGTRAWLTVGLLLGLAGLAKYTAAPLAVGVLLVMLRRHGPRVLAASGPWLAAALCLALISPVLLWNADHDWISIRYQLGHGAGDGHWSPVDLLATQVAQLVAFGPWLVLVGWRWLLGGWRATADDDVALVGLGLAAPTAALFAFASGFEVNLPHWWAVVWVLLAPLVARDALTGPPGRAARWGRRVSLGLGGLVLVVVHAELWLPFLPLEGEQHPLRDMVGWDRAADAAERQLTALECDGTLFADNWSRASRLAWYARPLPVQVLDERVDQFDLWFGAPGPGDCGLLVQWDDEWDDRPPGDLRRFARHELVEELEVTRAGRRLGRFLLHACHDHR